MRIERTDSFSSFGHLDLREKREYLSVLSDVVWDIEMQLAQVKAERAALMSSLQADLHDSLRGRLPRPCAPQSPDPTRVQEQQ